MDIVQLFNIVNQYEAFNFALWNIYVAVALGLLGYAIGGDKLRRLCPRIVLTIGFVAFAVANCRYLERNLVVINASAQEITTKLHKNSHLATQEFRSAISRWAEMQPVSLRYMHAAVDVLVALFLLFGPRLMAAARTNSSKTETDPAADP